VDASLLPPSRVQSILHEPLALKMSSQDVRTGSRPTTTRPDPIASLDDSWTLSHWEETEAEEEVLVVVEQEEALQVQEPPLQVVPVETLQAQPSYRFEYPSSSPLSTPHPTVSLGMRRVSSCYLSIHSTNSEGNTSVEDLWSRWDDHKAASAAAVPTTTLKTIAASTSTSTPGDSKETASVTDAHTKGAAAAASQRTSLFHKNMTMSDMDSDRSTDWNEASCDLLYHDILMHVFTFLDAKDLVAFSETARRPNFECFYFLQLQLQRALLLDNDADSDGSSVNSTAAALLPRPAVDKDPLSAIAGVGSISRLVVMDRPEAEQTVQGFLDSNSTLRTMPLSHSLAYIRQVLRLNNGFFTDYHQQNQHHQHGAPQQAALASAALVITCVGAASFMSGDHASVMSEMASFGTELPNMLFKVGFVGSLMGAATRTMQHQHQQHQHQSSPPVSSPSSATTHKPEQGLRERAEQMARHMQELSKHVMEQMRAQNHPQGQFSSLSRMMQNAYDATYGEHHDAADSTEMTTNANSSRHHVSPEKLSTPNPYEHLPGAINTTRTVTASTTTTGSTSAQQAKDDDDDKAESSSPDSEHSNNGSQQKMPSGCVGAYSRAVARANARIVDIVKAKRKASLLALPEAEQLQISSGLIDACCSDESFSIVRDLIQVRGSVDVEGFYVGSDGTETCALHAAAFHGSCKILELLCTGIDESDPTQDGGLCDVNMKDDNGWTSMHFAAGANSVEAVRILAKHGAALSVEASNGYTPLQWAVRLSNEKVAEELRQQMGTELGWISRQPLSAIASRFFALIPSN
jgi:hypothetical protein